MADNFAENRLGSLWYVCDWVSNGGITTWEKRAIASLDYWTR